MALTDNLRLYSPPPAPQIEFDPALDVDLVHTPRGWRDADLFVSGPDFLEAMRPLLDTYLAAQGEAPLQDLEWQVRHNPKRHSLTC